MFVSGLVRREIVRQYGVEAPREVVSILDATTLPDLPPGSRARDCVQLGVLLFGAGHVDRVREAARLAAVDGRDLLVSAGLADENWPTVLVAAGYPAP